MGRDVPSQEISATKGDGIDELLELVHLVGQMVEPTSDSEKNEAIVIEAKRDERAGVLVTLLVRHGSLHKKDFLFSDRILGSVKSMVDEYGKQIVEAGASTPVVVSGFSELPERGAMISISSKKPQAQDLIKTRTDAENDESLQFPIFLGAEVSYNEEEDSDVVLLLKSDVQGSLPAMVRMLGRYDWQALRVKIVLGGVGVITENDISMARISHAIVIGFKVNISRKIEEFAERSGVILHLIDVIYDLDEIVEKIVRKLAPLPESEFEEIGTAEIKKLFHSEPISSDSYSTRSIIGGSVLSGEFRNTAKANLIRKNKKVGLVSIESLQSDRKDAVLVIEGSMYGAEVYSSTNIKEGDTLSLFMPVTQS